MQYHAIPCNTMQNHAIPCKTMTYHAIPCNIMQYHAKPCNTLQYHVISCNTMQSHAKPCNTMQYYAIPCNTMQYYAIQNNAMPYHAIPCIINNCWRSVPLPCGQYNGHFFFQQAFVIAQILSHNFIISGMGSMRFLGLEFLVLFQCVFCPHHRDDDDVFDCNHHRDCDDHPLLTLLLSSPFR